MRSLTWSSVAKAIAALLALAVPATIVALMVSNLPLPQMTHGNVLRLLTRGGDRPGRADRAGPAAGVRSAAARASSRLVKRFIQSFGSVGSLSFVLMSFVAAAGIAASPALLSRSGTTPGVYEARKSLGWAVLVVGLVLLTLPAVAVYLRALLLEQVVGHPGDRLPVWFQLLQQAGIARIEAKTPGRAALPASASSATRSLFALPIAAGFPQVLVYLALAGALAAALAALAPSLVAIAAILAEDVVTACPTRRRRTVARIGTARVALLGAAFVTDLAGHRGAGRPAAAVPVVAHLERVGILPGAAAGDLGGSGPMPGERWPA